MSTAQQEPPGFSEARVMKDAPRSLVSHSLSEARRAAIAPRSLAVATSRSFAATARRPRLRNTALAPAVSPRSGRLAAGPRSLATAGAESGVSLVGLMVAIAILSLGLMVALPGWTYVIQDDREQELIFRGNEIARAIERYQAKHGGALPVSLEVLVKGKFLRKRYKEPFAPDGEWRFIRPGQIAGLLPGSERGGLGRSVLRPSPSPGSTSSRELGALAGVGTRHKGKSLRLFNGLDRYEEWGFVAGQPRTVGRGFGRFGGALPGGLRPPGALPSGFPGTPGSPPPSPQNPDQQD